MRAPARPQAPQFSQPVRQVASMLAVLGLIGAGGWFAYGPISAIFQANPWLNGVIFAVFGAGVIACFWQVAQLIKAVSWIESFAADRPGRPHYKAPQMLAPLAALLGARGSSRSIATSAARSILESVGTRIDEARDITRYLSNLLIFLGLLGTFYGLATTVPGVVETIRALAPQPGESATLVFERLMGGLENQLGGMGTAFSSSLLGLAGSLVVGLLELFVTHGQNRFYRELEEWISSITRLSFAAAEGDSGEASAVAEILDHMAEQMDALQSLFTRAEHARAQTETQLAHLTQSFADFAGRMSTEVEQRNAQAQSLSRMAAGQDRLIGAMEALSQRAEADQEAEVDGEMRMRLRSIDLQLSRLLEEMAAGRQESMAELRNDFAALTRAILSRGRTGG
ncbi:biopolymer transporter ExbB [Rhodobacter sp. TJ_12]|uniref:biopolymer transporter ExbB n=1 Tax=Rhodobacter sp. TJ_12 TaxID=2029399 RepID=UPI001CBA9D9F|nr:biopolymer transporter ExbB [Rhodobacter sp. TJ_12]MBZ4022353.1 biopolymer transporter ExbB [Rhodobacter sp. TJ_12]